ncbi:MAG: hypothetical protein IPL95_11265 [Saprospiraceae bacterium]|nr:hypothetical protein [Saprospiraceae bacterium]
MKNNSSFTSISKSILLVLCLWFIGISVSNGQGWVKDFGNEKLMLTSFKFNNNIGIISYEYTSTDSIIYLIELDNLGNQISKKKLFNNKGFATKYRFIDNEHQILLYSQTEDKAQLYKLDNNGLVSLLKEYNKCKLSKNIIYDDNQFNICPYIYPDTIFSIGKNGEKINQIYGFNNGLFYFDFIKFQTNDVIVLKDSNYVEGIAKFNYNGQLIWNNNYFHQNLIVK